MQRSITPPRSISERKIASKGDDFLTAHVRTAEKGKAAPGDRMIVPPTSITSNYRVPTGPDDDFLTAHVRTAEKGKANFTYGDRIVPPTSITSNYRATSCNFVSQHVKSMAVPEYSYRSVTPPPSISVVLSHCATTPDDFLAQHMRKAAAITHREKPRESSFTMEELEHITRSTAPATAH